MSAIAGTWTRRGAPIDRPAVQRISRGLAWMGPDDECFADVPPVYMAYRPFHTDGESRRLHQPIVTHDGYVLSFAGRLDNAGELVRDLRVRGRGQLGTVGLVIEAYREWGLDAFARLIGDFVFALWDPHDSRLVLGVDSVGRGTLYFRCTPDAVYWSSACRPLLGALQLPVELDEEYLADFLANRTPAGSPFRGIESIPGGHVLVVSEESATLRRYWAPDPDRRITYGSDREYEEHLLTLFEEAVACRLRADGPVFCELSGGLDSSTIVCVADRLVKSGRVEAPEIQTISSVFERSASSDETAYIEQVEDWIGRRGHRLSETECPLLQPIPDTAAPDVPTNSLCFLSREDRWSRLMRDAGSRVVLSGIGGDHLFWSQPDPGLPLADLLVQGRVLEAVRSCAQWSSYLGLPFVKTLWVGGLRPILPRRWQKVLQREHPLGEWIAPAFARRVDLRSRMLPLNDDVGFRLPTTSRQYGYIRRAMRPFALERYSGVGRIEVRYPYLDRRLIEFALAIPLDQILRIGESRSIVRRAFRGLVPESVLQRRTKAGPTEAFYRALDAAWPWISELVADPLVSALGIVDRDAFRRALLRARHGTATHQAQLQTTLSLELWLRTLESRPHAGDTVPPGRRRSSHQGGRYVEGTQGVPAARGRRARRGRGADPRQSGLRHRLPGL